jgi:hypothetical protein
MGKKKEAKKAKSLMLGRFRVPRPPEKRPMSTGKEQPTCLGLIFLIFLYALKKITGDTLPALPRFQRSLVIKKIRLIYFIPREAYFQLYFDQKKQKTIS